MKLFVKHYEHIIIALIGIKIIEKY